MQAFSSAQLLDLWETARAQHPLDRALTILAAGAPEISRSQLAQLSIGERDALLMQLRALVCGSQAEGFAECPRCGEELEVPLDTAAFHPPNEFSDETPKFEFAGRQISFRLPDSRDLAAVVRAPDSHAGLNILLDRCLSPNESDFSGEEIVERFGEALLAADPRAEISLQLQCPACAHRWSALFDIGEFFWQEIAARARGLVREIDALARAYGWTETEILRLSPQRRQTYLDLIAG